jgi:site-specific DNA recombinase
VLKAAVYARYSSGLQRPTSIDDQVALCRSAAQRFGCEIIEDLIITDYEISGSDERRAGYQRLLAAARTHKIDAAIVESQDRLWRNQAEMHNALRLLRFHNVRVFSIAAGADMTDYSGRVLATVMGLKDEMYLDDLRAKTHRGLAGQARRGFSAGGRSYGYRTEPVTDPQSLDPHGQPRILG